MYSASPPSPPSRDSKGMKIEISEKEDNYSPPGTPKFQRRSRKVDYAALAGVGVSPKSKREDDKAAAEAMLAQHKALTTALTQRERLLREMILLQQGSSMIDYDLSHQKVTQALTEYEARRGFAQKFDIPQDELEFLEQQASDEPSEDEGVLQVRVPVAALGTTMSKPIAPHYEELVSEAAHEGPLTATAVVSLPAPSAMPQLMTVPRVMPSTPSAIDDKAQQDGHILARVSALKSQGLWAGDRIPKAPEAPRSKNHWDFLLEEMIWLANDVIEERKWKMSLAKKIAKNVARYWETQSTKGDRDKKVMEINLKKIASNMAKEIKKFWGNIEKIAKYKYDMKMETKKKEIMDRKLEMLVGQTEKYSDMLAKNLTAEPEVVKEAPSLQSAISAEPVDEDDKADEGYTSAINTDALANMAKGSGSSDDDDSDDDDLKKSKAMAENIVKRRRINEDGRRDALNAIASNAMESMPTGTTLATTKVHIRPPFLLKGSLREYQQVGLEWLVSLYNKRLNGILADEMGLGKTIQTIALGIWGPHLIVVPTSVMLNWECEFKKWCPAFKILTYYGSAKERKNKRQGWTRTNAFHLAVQDHLAFRRKKWKYLILDEAHTIKNFKSMRWQTLINFNSKRRLLLTGTPLQNNLMELWSLMHFLMPTVFESHAEFKEWFSNPMNDMVADNNVNNDIVSRLHSVLRPFLLRRLKAQVETQLPSKQEHIIPVTLSKRQRILYEEYIQRSDTKKIMEGGNFLSMINVLMQLRKVCNHPDLFEEHPILSPFDCAPIDGLTKVGQAYYGATWHPSLVIGITGSMLGGSVVHLANETAAVVESLKESGSVMDALQLNISFMNLLLIGNQLNNDYWAEAACHKYAEHDNKINISVVCDPVYDMQRRRSTSPVPGQSNPLLAANDCTRSRLFGPYGAKSASPDVVTRLMAYRTAVVEHHNYINKFKTSLSRLPLYSNGLVRMLEAPVTSDVNALTLTSPANFIKNNKTKYLDVPDSLFAMIKGAAQRHDDLHDEISNFCFVRPSVRAVTHKLHSSHPNVHLSNTLEQSGAIMKQLLTSEQDILHDSIIRQQLYFPDRNLLQYDCGKLQVLDTLLRQLKAGSHRVLIFTQMSRMLDILEKFLTYHGHVHLRLDGATKPEARQQLMERFNNDTKVFCFILSTRSGGIGVNLTGADTVIFYDSDWNPAMDAQAQDRCHRIGQTRDVHVYRLVSTSTIEENIFIKATQKRFLDQLVITKGNFTTDFFNQKNIRDLLSTGDSNLETAANMTSEDVNKALAAAEDEDDVVAARNVERELKITTAMDVGDNAEGAADDAALRDESPADALSEPVPTQPVEPALDSIEAQMTPIQRLAFRLLESMDPTQPPGDGSDENQSDQGRMDVEQLLKLREEQEAENDDDDEMLYYEVDNAPSMRMGDNVNITGSARAFRDKAYDEMQNYYENLPLVTSAVTPTAHKSSGPAIKAYAPPIDEESEVYGPLGEEYQDTVEDLIKNKKSQKKKTKKKRKTVEAELTLDWAPLDTKREARKRELYFGEDSEYYTDDEANFTRKRRATAAAPAPVAPPPAALLDATQWTPIQDNILRDVVQEYGPAWDLAADSVNHTHAWGSNVRVTPEMCKERYNVVLSHGLHQNRQEYALPQFQLNVFKQAYELQLKNRNQRPPDSASRPSMQCHESHNKAVQAAEAELTKTATGHASLAPLSLADIRLTKDRLLEQAQQKAGAPAAPAAAQATGFRVSPNPVQINAPPAVPAAQVPPVQAPPQARPSALPLAQPPARSVTHPPSYDFVLAEKCKKDFPESVDEVDKLMAHSGLTETQKAQAIQHIYNKRRVPQETKPPAKPM